LKKLTPSQLKKAYIALGVLLLSVLAWVWIPNREIIGEQALTKRIENLNQLGWFYANKGDYNKARELYTQAYEMGKGQLPKDSRIILACMTNVAWVEKLFGNYTASLKLFEEVYDAHLAIQGPDHREALNCKVNIANLNYMRGNLDTASQLYREILEVSSRTLGSEDLYTLNNQINLASVLRATEKSGEAITVLEKTLQVLTEVHGRTHATTLHALLELVKTYVSADAYPQAEFHLLKLLGLYKETSSAIDTRLLVHSMLADCYRSMHLFEEAIEHLLIVRNERHEHYGLSNLLTAAVLFELGKVYADAGDRNKAIESLSQAESIAIRRLGPSHPWSQQIHAELEKVRRVQQLLHNTPN